MVAELEELEAHREAVPPLTAQQYRGLWLADAHTLGLIACTLASALGWQATEADPLPDALMLAQVAAERIRAMQAQAIFALISQGARQSNMNYLTITAKRA